MTYDTWDSYNTDEAYKDKGTTAKGLVAAYKKDNPEGTKEDFYSKLNKTWAEDKNGYVKAAVDDAFKVKTETAPKAEEKTEEKTVENKVTPVSNTRTQNYLNKQDEVAENAKQTALNDAKKDSEYNWKELYDTQIKRAEANNNIDDHMLEQLPTFIFRRYQNGEFGDISDTSTPEGRESKKNAQLRMAHFMINGVGTALSNASNVIKGKELEQSDYEKYQNSNLEQGIANRWKKYNADTEEAIKLANKEAEFEQDARMNVEQLTRDRKANTRWNAMDQNQKLYAIEISREIGKLVGDMDISELGNFITGAVMNGTMDKDQVIAVGIAKLVQTAPKILEQLPDGNIKDMVMSMIGGSASDIVAGIGGAGGDSNGNGSNENNGDIPATGVKLSDGTVVDPGKMMSINDFSAIDKAATNLSNKYYRGEITEEEFRDDYNKLYNLVKKHNLMNKITGKLKPVDTRIKELKGDRIDYWDRQIDDLNTKAKNGQIKPSEYNEKFAEYEKSLVNAGGNAKKTAKKKMSTEAIIKASEKIDKVKTKTK